MQQFFDQKLLTVLRRVDNLRLFIVPDMASVVSGVFLACRVLVLVRILMLLNPYVQRSLCFADIFRLTRLASHAVNDSRLIEVITNSFLERK